MKNQYFEFGNLRINYEYADILFRINAIIVFMCIMYFTYDEPGTCLALVIIYYSLLFHFSSEDEVAEEKHYIMKEYWPQYDAKTLAEKRAKYEIIKFEFCPECQKFAITLNEKVEPGIGLELKFDDQWVTVSYVSERSKFYFSHEVSTRNDNIVLSLGEKTYSYPNPYQLKLDPNFIECQIKGGDGELCVYISHSGMPNAEENINYVFDVKINRKIYEGFVGKFDKQSNKIVVGLREIQEYCLKNSCQLRAHFEKNYFTQLPKPKIIVFRNGVPITI